MAHEGDPMYCPSQEMVERIEKNFQYHPPVNDQQIRYEKIRAESKDLARTLVESCPNSRELSMALSHLEEMVMWANSSIARNEQSNLMNEMQGDGKLNYVPPKNG